jgi:hypothetical protein
MTDTPTRITVDNASHIETVLARFGQFHDFLITSITVTSRDRLEMESSEEMSACQVITGLFDMQTVLESPYRTAQNPNGKEIIHATFHGVSDLMLDLRPEPDTHIVWAVYSLKISPDSATTRHDRESSFALEVTCDCHHKDGGWHTRPCIVSSFRSAEFEIRHGNWSPPDSRNGNAAT